MAFSVISDDEPDNVTPLAPKAAAPARKVDTAAIQAMLIAFKALSARALIAIADLFTLITVLTVFWAWMSVPDPNANQLVGLGGYALFVVAVNIIVRRK